MHEPVSVQVCDEMNVINKKLLIPFLNKILNYFMILHYVKIHKISYEGKRY